jgi:drug/metabolite transporter (DMT)-like permease
MEIESEPLQKTKHHEDNNGCSTAGLVTFMLGLVSGTFSALLCKMAYDTESVGVTGESKAFAKPIMMLTLMFAGMSPALFFWFVQQQFTAPEKRDVVSYRTIGILIIPSLCDLMCTLLLLVAQLYITASLWQMMRGSIIIITALLKRYALDHRLKKHMWLGVGFITFAMLLVASTSFFTPAGADRTAAEPNGKDPRIGILLVVVGCIAQGVQCT